MGCSILGIVFVEKEKCELLKLLTVYIYHSRHSETGYGSVMEHLCNIHRDPGFDCLYNKTKGGTNRC